MGFEPATSETLVRGKVDDENGLVSVSLLIYLFVRLATDLAMEALYVLGFQRKSGAVTVE